MSNRELDRIMRERLEHFEMEPPMHLWENIAAARAGAQRPLRPWMWWSGGFGVLALSAGIGIWLLLGQTSWMNREADFTAPKIQAMADPDADPCTTVALPADVSTEETQEALPVATVAVSPALARESGKHVQAFTVAAGEEVPFLAAASSMSSLRTSSAFDGLHTGLKSINWNYRPKDGFPEKSCNAFSKEKWKMNWHLELVGSPEYVFRTLHSRTPEYADYAAARNEMEEIRGGFTAGVRVSAVTDFGVSLRSGIQYAQINEVFNYRDNNDIRTIVTNVYDGQGNIIGSDTIFEAGTHIKVTYNRHRMVDIPVMVGYEFQFPRFSMAVHGGASFNLLFRQKGDILGPQEEPVAISSDASNGYPVFRDRLGVSLVGSIGFNYRLTPELQFILEPQFRVILDPVTRQDYPLSQEYFLTGITMGVRQRL
ncbi:MAG: PorT family protein [Saprospirales bacterium]|nr:PorT family protein [Saprospirales bacterium]MBK8491636.1 PorT family protein [Saprospirales bacterium]